MTAGNPIQISLSDQLECLQKMTVLTVEVVDDLLETSLFSNLNDNLLNRICPHVSIQQGDEWETAAH